jgi:hypothetical protein
MKCADSPTYKDTVVPHDFTQSYPSEHPEYMKLLLSVIFFSYILFEHNCEH